MTGNFAFLGMLAMAVGLQTDGVVQGVTLPQPNSGPTTISIARDGKVTQAQSAGSDLPDAGVVACITRAFYGLSFPENDTGVVTVSYPISLTPG